MEWLTVDRWSPYTVGIGIGLLSCLTFLLSDKAIGCSTAFARTSGMFERLVRGAKVDQNAYYKKFPAEIDWEWMLVFGLAVGALISSVLSGQFSIEWVPDIWASKMGEGVPFRLVMALIAGVLMGFGARWAGGCTSGHGISGTLQLALSSWIAACCFFIGGIASAMLLLKVLS